MARYGFAGTPSKGERFVSLDQHSLLAGVLVAVVGGTLLIPIGHAAWSHYAEAFAPSVLPRPELDPLEQQYASTRLQLKLAIEQERWGAAEELAKELLGFRTTDGQVWRWMGTAQVRLGRDDKAELAWRQAITFAPYRIASLYELAGSLARQGKSDEAIEVLEETFGLGFRDSDQVLSDPTFDSLHHEPRWHQMFASLPTP